MRHTFRPVPLASFALCSVDVHGCKLPPSVLFAGGTKEKGSVDEKMQICSLPAPSPVVHKTWPSSTPSPPSVKEIVEIVARPQNGYGAWLEQVYHPVSTLSPTVYLMALISRLAPWVDTLPDRSCLGSTCRPPTYLRQNLIPFPPRHGWSGSEKGTTHADPEHHC
ncbi:hypothetical protein DFH07DRAFT_772246 [Mycena maculata]|uniref:Uncharacterized protein n=1 Tax=Mycena maculata TaxID=230809 RepID=A0AAD7J8E0_9AGAR|nr:hypothetical protein DFH07DRAFT_772246 [Mycena maculata]